LKGSRFKEVKVKTAIYIEDGILQIVLTPKTTFEKEVCSKIEQSDLENTKIYRGQFYKCQGGWTLQGERDYSLILRMEAPNV